jgi:hypothetical protein
MPEAGQGTLTDQLSGLLKALVSRIDSESLRLVYTYCMSRHNCFGGKQLQV